MKEIVQLNVGGTHFETTRTTLTSYPGSLLARMFDPDSKLPPAAVTEDGAFFLDACPRAFVVILNYLRYKEILGIGKEVLPEDVIPVADYFGLLELSAKLEALKKPVTQNINDGDIIRLNVGGTIYETTRGTMTKKPGTKLAEMFKPGSRTSPPITADGGYFIDACPRAFEIVLNWVRVKGEAGLKIYNRNVDISHVSQAAKTIGLEIRHDGSEGGYIVFFL